MFDRFTEQARKAVLLAQKEARHLGHDSVGTEHILLGLLREPEGGAVRALSALGVERSEARRELERMLDGGRSTAPADEDASLTLFRARVLKLEVRVCCGVSEEERASPQTLLVDLKYEYEAQRTDEISGVVDYGALLEEAARTLERGEFKLLETGARRVGEQILSRFPAIRELTVTVTKPRVPVARMVSGASVEATFRR